MKTNRSHFLLSFFFISVLFLFTPSFGFGWQGKVVGVMDGDTITVMHDGKAEKIRFYGIDCPEGHQDFSQNAKQFTSSMVFGKTVDVKKMDTDRYGRTVAVVTIDGKTVNEELLKSGMAWFFTKYCKESFCEQWKRCEEAARKSKVGLWSMPNPIAPWDFRKAHPKP